MDSRDFLFPLNRIASLKLSSLLVDKDQPETAWYLLTPSTKVWFTARRSTLAPNRETKGHLHPAIVGLPPFYHHQRDSRFLKRSEGITVENVWQQIAPNIIDLIDHPRATGISSCKLWQLFFEHHLQIFKKCQDIKTILMRYPDDEFCYEVCDAFCGPTGLSIVAEFDQQGDVTGWSVYYNLADKVLAGPYDFVEEAQLMAALLAKFNWTRPASAFTRRELYEITRMIISYREDTEWLKKVIIETVLEYYRAYSKNGNGVAKLHICMVN
jgi:hypothetical protein